MNASVAGSLFMMLIGVAFLCAALVGWWRLGDDVPERVRGRIAAVIDLLVGAAAIGDATVSVLGEPERLVVWSVGSAALVAAVGLLVVHHRRHRPQPWNQGRLR